MISNLLIYTESDKNAVVREFGRTLDSLKIDVATINEWVEKQPHLPERPSDVLIERFLLMSKMSVEKTKKLLDMYYTIRSYIPEFYGRTYCDPKLQKSMDVMCYIPLPKLTKDLQRVIIAKFNDTNPDNFKAMDTFAHIINLSEIRIREDFCAGEIVIIDGSGFTLNHIKQLTPMALRKLSLVIEKVFPARLPVTVYINAPPVVDILVNIMKTLMKKKLTDRIKIDRGTSTLLDQFPKEIIPSNYGGDEKSMEELNEDWKAKIMEWNDWFERRKNVVVDEKLRPEPLYDNDLFGLEGNFKKLDFD